MRVKVPAAVFVEGQASHIAVQRVHRRCITVHVGGAHHAAHDRVFSHRGLGHHGHRRVVRARHRDVEARRAAATLAIFNHVVNSKFQRRVCGQVVVCTHLRVKRPASVCVDRQAVNRSAHQRIGGAVAQVCVGRGQLAADHIARFGRELLLGKGCHRCIVRTRDRDRHDLGRRGLVRVCHLDRVTQVQRLAVRQEVERFDARTEVPSQLTRGPIRGHLGCVDGQHGLNGLCQHGAQQGDISALEGLDGDNTRGDDVGGVHIADGQGATGMHAQFRLEYQFRIGIARQHSDGRGVIGTSDGDSERLINAGASRIRHLVLNGDRALLAFGQRLKSCAQGVDGHSAVLIER